MAPEWRKSMKWSVKMTQKARFFPVSFSCDISERPAFTAGFCLRLLHLVELTHFLQICRTEKKRIRRDPAEARGSAPSCTTLARQSWPQTALVDDESIFVVVFNLFFKKRKEKAP